MLTRATGPAVVLSRRVSSVQLLPGSIMLSRLFLTAKAIPNSLCTPSHSPANTMCNISPSVPLDPILKLLRTIPDRHKVGFIMDMLSNRSFVVHSSDGWRSALRRMKSGVRPLADQ